MLDPASSHHTVPPPKNSSLKKLAIHATLWTISGHGASQMLRLGANLILTRLLVPELFGLVSLVNVFIIGLHLFSDIGIGPSIIQNKRGDEPAFYNTAWTLQAIRGGIVWFGCILIAWPISTFYGEPRLLWLIPLIGIDALTSGFNSTALYTLNRHLEVRQITLYALSGQVLCLTIMIVWAWISPSIWALVVGNIASAVIQMLRSHRLTPTISNHFAWDKTALASLSTFGRWIFVSTALTFLAEQADRLILGKLVSFELLGVYSIAFIFSDIPRQIVLIVSSRVLFPALVKLVDLPREELQAKILKYRWSVLLAVGFSLTLLITVGDGLIFALYDQRYEQASWMLPVLALGIWPRVLTQTIDQVLFAIGKVQYPTYGCFFKFLFVLIGIPLGFSLLGLPGAVIVVALNDLPFYAAILYGLQREGLSCVTQDIKATAAFLAMLAVALSGRAAFGFGLPVHGMF